MITLVLMVMDALGYPPTRKRVLATVVLDFIIMAALFAPLFF